MIVVVASYLLYVMAAGFAAVWWFVEDRAGKLQLVVAAIIGLLLVGVFILVAATGLIAGLIVFLHHVYGALLAVGAVLVAAARVAAHAHHLQDVVAGLVLGFLAAGLATLLATTLIFRLELVRRLGLDSGAMLERAS